MTRTITIDVTDHRLIVSANRRIHWAQRARVCRFWRDITRLKARQHGIPELKRAHVTITVRFPNNRRRDVGNLHPYLAKPCVDGLVDAGVLPDDSDEYLTGPDLRREQHTGPHQVRIDIEEVV